MKYFSSKVKFLFLFLIVINVLLSAYWLICSDIHYDVDVSRDLLVIDDIVRNNHFTLLGPRSGAIPGLFHGPLWFYVNLPAFIIGGGNPLVIGWFWLGLSISFLWIIFWVAKKLFDFKIAIISVLLFSVNSIINPAIGLKNFYNPYGAVFLFPIFFWLFYQYLNVQRIKYLILSLFILGLIIQFQMAFGIPLLITITIFLGFFCFNKRKNSHMLSYFILILPLSSFIIFDFKHNGLQLNALIQFLSHQSNSGGNLLNIIDNRMKALIFDFFDFFSPGKNFLTIFFAIFFLVVFGMSLIKNNYSHKKIYRLFAYLFVSFWLISLIYSGGVGNYFWPFLPLTIIIFCSFIREINQRVFVIVFLVLYLINLYTGVSAILNFNKDVNKRGPHSWAFNLLVAKNIYKDAQEDFGYFNFSPDRFAYQQRYALAYAKSLFPNIHSFSSAKKPLTYLIEVDPPKDRPELNGTNWRISDVGIDRLPDKAFRFDFIQVEKYFLNKDEIKAQSNPYLLDNVFLR